MDAQTKRYYIYGGIVLGLVVLGAWAYRNRYKLFEPKNPETLDLETPFEKVQAMGAHPGLDSGGAKILRYNTYLFYTNNRAFAFGPDKKISKKGTFDKNQIVWDGGKGTTPLQEIFS